MKPEFDPRIDPPPHPGRRAQTWWEGESWGGVTVGRGARGASSLGRGRQGAGARPHPASRRPRNFLAAGVTFSALQFSPLLLAWDEIIVSVLRECPTRCSQDGISVCVWRGIIWEGRSTSNFILSLSSQQIFSFAGLELLGSCKRF